MKRWNVQYAYGEELEKLLEDGWEPIGGFYDRSVGEYVCVLRKEVE